MKKTTASNKQSATLESAQRYFNDGLYERALPLLNSLVSQNLKSPDLHHMLGTIHYEKGQFKSSILSFKRALHIDPYFTDSSIGLSVVLNDLGKYQQAQEVFKDAQVKLKKLNSDQPVENLNSVKSVNSEIAQKHYELSQLYKSNQQPQLAFQNLVQYEELRGETMETVLEKAELQRRLSNFSFAAEIMKSWWNDDPQLSNQNFFLKLAELYYLDRKVVAALETCALGLKLGPKNSELLDLHKRLTNTEFNLRQPEI